MMKMVKLDLSIEENISFKLFIKKKIYFFLFFYLSINISFSQNINNKYIVGIVSFYGNETINNSELRNIIKLKDTSFFSSVQFNRRSLKIDSFNIRNFYTSKGFLNVTVKDSFNINKDNSVNIFYKINEGLRSTIQSIEISGNKSFENKEIEKILNLRVGKPFNIVDLGNKFSELEFEYHKIGKLYFNLEQEYFSKENIELKLTVDEGPDVFIDKIFLRGLDAVDSLYVFREIGFKSGERYNSEKIILTERHIFETSLFSMVNILPEKSSRMGNWVNVIIDLKELEKRNLLIEPGFAHIPSSSSGGEPISGLEGSFNLVDRNLYNLGIRMRFNSALDFPIDFLNNDFSVPIIFRSSLSLDNNWLFKLRAPNTFRFFIDRSPELLRVDSPILRYGLEWSGLRRFSRKTILRGGLKWTQIFSENNFTLIQNNESQQERSINLKFQHRDLDNLIYPTSGWTFSIDGEVVGWLLGGSQDYYKVEMDLKKFTSLSNGKVLGFRGKVGRMERLFESAPYIPSYDLFYLGGSTSLRGWSSQRYLSEVDDNGIIRPVGGLIKLLFNSEIRIPIYKIIGANLFVDGGALAISIEDLMSQINNWNKGYGWNYGAELTINTPLGPIRLYYAIPLSNPKNSIINLGVPFAF